MMQPVMRFDVDRYCSYECKVCTEICPNGAILPLTIEEKKITRVGVAKFHIDVCKVYVDEMDCGACAEHCPTGAARMVPYKGTLTIPEVDENYCIGCGGCESICPIVPGRAITVSGVLVQNLADKPEDSAIELDDVGFGF
jgi:ferredoxin